MGNHSQDKENTGWKKTTEDSAQEVGTTERGRLNDMIELADAPEEAESVQEKSEQTEELDLADRAEAALRQLEKRCPVWEEPLRLQQSAAYTILVIFCTRWAFTRSTRWSNGADC